jgi:hypothetical protein
MLDLRRAGLAAQPLVLVLAQQLPHAGLAHSRDGGVVRELRVLPEDVGEGGVAGGAFERRGTVEHLEDEDADGPPVDSGRVAAAFDDLRRNVLFGTNKGLCAYVSIGADAPRKNARWSGNLPRMTWCL